MTQLIIKPGSLFICGPINGNLLEADKKFSLAEEVLNSYGLKTVNQFILFTSKKLMVDNLKYTIMHLIGCSTVVTLHQWAGCDFAKKQVEISRIMGIDIVDYSKLVLDLTKIQA